MDYGRNELMVVTAARELRNGETVLVGVGLPNLACNLAKRLHAPKLVMIYESGVVGAKPSRLPLSIGDPCIVTNSESVCSMFEVFGYYLQPGRVDVGFLGGAQIDKFGNINTTVIGDYRKPKVRLPGSGGACDIAHLVKKILIITPHQKRRFVNKLDFLTSPGKQLKKEEESLETNKEVREIKVITDLCVLSLHNRYGELVVEKLHPKVTLEEVQENTGWKLKVSEELKTTPEPKKAEIRVLRELDPTRIYL